MLLKLSGWFRAHTSGPATKYVDATKQRLMAGVREEQTSTIHQSDASITFTRGYNEWPYSANRFANFDPVRISLRAENGAILIRYDLGLKPLYVLFGVLAVGTAYLLYLYTIPLPIVIPVVVVPLSIAIGITFFNMWRVHIWLKSTVLSTVAKTLPTDNSTK